MQPSDDLIDRAVEFLLYPQGDDAQLIFEDAILSETTVSTASALLVPSPAEMKEEIASDSNRIGFLPAGVVDPSVNVIEIVADTAPLITSRPILAISAEKPGGLTAEWLACLQAELAP